MTVAAIPAAASAAVIRGRARQVRVMRQNSRCSILFHFDVPGGKCMTVIASPVSAASSREPGLPKAADAQELDPPASQVTSSPPGAGVAQAALPSSHQRRTDARPRTPACHGWSRR